MLWPFCNFRQKFLGLVFLGAFLSVLVLACTVPTSAPATPTEAGRTVPTASASTASPAPRVTATAASPKATQANPDRPAAASPKTKPAQSGTVLSGPDGAGFFGRVFVSPGAGLHRPNKRPSDTNRGGSNGSHSIGVHGLARSACHGNRRFSKGNPGQSRSARRGLP